MIKKLSLFLLTILLLFGLGGYYVHEHYLYKPLPIKNELIYTVKPGQSMTDIALDLMDQNLINYPTALVWVWKARFAKQDVKIKSGDFAIPIGTSLQDFLDILISGAAVNYSITFLEGWNFARILTQLESNPYLTKTITGLSPQRIMAELGYLDEHPEGRFFPDTYLFAKNEVDINILKRAYYAMESILYTEWDRRQANLPFKTAYEALILASIVEKEAAKAEERPIIAKVFINRLNINMKLQTDPTVIYALGDSYEGKIKSDDLRIDNKYNTYIYDGLPPTPIAMPGRHAIQAVLNPGDTKALFFVAKGDGTHHFSRTDAEHGCAVIRYQLTEGSSRYKQWCQRYSSCDICR